MASIMSQRPQSKLIGQFANVRVGHNWKDGDEIDVAQIVQQEGNAFVARTKSGREYRVEISDIRNLINVTATQEYNIGDEVEAVVDYHWKEGECYDFGKITSVKKFGNDIEYEVYIFKQKKTLTVIQSHIKCRVALKTAKYSRNQRIGVKHCDGHPYFYDEYVKNGTIIAVDVGYDRVTYSVKYDDGVLETVSEYSITSPVVVKTAAEKEQDYAKYLQSEEQRLLQQLENVRLQMRR